MRLKAYILAADPTWLEASVLSYYDLVEEVIVSYDENGIGYTGVPIAVETCLQRLKAIDRDGKFRYCPGHYARMNHTPMENETYQRQCAIKQIGDSTDWILQLDTDEVLPNGAALNAMLQTAQDRGKQALDWPMRVLYRRLRDGRILEICCADGQERFEYPGPIAIRSQTNLQYARRADLPFLRPVVRGDNRSPELLNPLGDNEERIELAQSSEAILHNSWARSSKNVRSKIATWSHNSGWRSWAYYYLRWLPTPYVWRRMRDFHPFAHGLWPALKPCGTFPTSIPEQLLRL